MRNILVEEMIRELTTVDVLKLAQKSSKKIAQGEAQIVFCTTEGEPVNPPEFTREQQLLAAKEYWDLLHKDGVTMVPGLEYQFLRRIKTFSRD